MNSDPAPSAAHACPAWPIGGKAVAAELDRVCPINPDDPSHSSCPAIDEWLERLFKLELQLEAAQ